MSSMLPRSRLPGPSSTNARSKLPAPAAKTVAKRPAAEDAAPAPAAGAATAPAGLAKRRKIADTKTAATRMKTTAAPATVPKTRPMGRTTAATSTTTAAGRKPLATFNATGRAAAAGKSASSAAAAPAKARSKRPAWDIKGRLADMEEVYAQTNTRVALLEEQNSKLKENVQEKEIVVATNSQELDSVIKERDSALEKIRKLRDELSEHKDDMDRTLRSVNMKLDEATRERDSLSLANKSLNAELSIKMTEIVELQQSVARSKASMAETEAEMTALKKLFRESQEKVAELTALSSRQAAQIDHYEEQERAFETERRRLHNTIQELKGNIRVFCRVRPLLSGELETSQDTAGAPMKKHDGHLDFVSDKALALDRAQTDNLDTTALKAKNNKYDFEFDRVFSPNTTQANVFDEISQLVQSAIDGYNVCVFAYGQTGSGKTWTMEGGPDAEEHGIIPRTIRKIFEDTEELKKKGWTYQLDASFLEIYNEEIRDLLATEKNLKYEIKMSANSSPAGTSKEVYVTNLKIERVTCPAEITSILRRAHKHRSVAATLCNERSSRSHSVFQLKITGTNDVTTESCSGMLHLVDLAGSERLKESGSEGARLTETKSINSSLANLGNVIMALAQKDSHVPYRNSKLTHLLQGSLGGNSKTLMFVNVSPKQENFGETLNSLRFATKVNQCHIGTASKKIK